MIEVAAVRLGPKEREILDRLQVIYNEGEGHGDDAGGVGWTSHYGSHPDPKFRLPMAQLRSLARKGVVSVTDESEKYGRGHYLVQLTMKGRRL